MTTDSQRTLSPGDVMAMPPGVVHSFTAQGNALILELSTPCLVDDNTFQDPAIAAWLGSSPQSQLGCLGRLVADHGVDLAG